MTKKSSTFITIALCVLLSMQAGNAHSQDFKGSAPPTLPHSGNQSPHAKSIEYWCLDNMTSRQAAGTAILQKCEDGTYGFGNSCFEGLEILPQSPAYHGIYLNLRLIDSLEVRATELLFLAFYSGRPGGPTLRSASSDIVVNNIVLRDGAQISVTTTGAAYQTGGTHTYASCQLTFHGMN